MLRVGIIGFGIMGHTHLNAWQDQTGIKVCAVCDMIFANGKPTDEIVGNINTASSLNLDGIDLFTDCDKMLAEANIDAVSVTLPTFLHCEFSLKALKAGVHVLCEKPMGINHDHICNLLPSGQNRAEYIKGNNETIINNNNSSDCRSINTGTAN